MSSITGLRKSFKMCVFIFSQVVLTQLPGQELHLEVFDKDMDMKDDFMGR